MITDQDRARIYDLFKNWSIFEEAVTEHQREVEAGKTERVDSYMREFMDIDAIKAMALPFEEWLVSNPAFRAKMDDTGLIAFPSPWRKLDDDTTMYRDDRGPDHE